MIELTARYYPILVTCLVLAGAPAAHADVAVVDATGKTITLQAPARRIVSLAPHVTELLYAAGAGPHVVGASDYSDYPAQAQALPRIGSFANIDLEAVMAKRPDLVVAWHSGNRSAQLDRLRALGVAVYVSEPRHLADIPADIERLGALAGTYRTAHAAAERFRAQHAKLARRYEARPPVRIFYEIWNQPLMTVNGQQIISDVIRLCGGVNVFADLPVLAPTVDVEAVLHADPEALFMGGEENRIADWRKYWGQWTQLRAVQAGHLYAIPPDLLQRHTPRMLLGAEVLCADLEQVRGHRPPTAAGPHPERR